ncbi:hypothetical protein L2E82_34523 [Cichorium intybus]|uniref:Uncharacterized protein n=1 Tax=Cichorium intybus TaxID=13427 RepID=A0ACB9BMA2_CICIN|nr:hypothetical protein L2E82_34523 [Cichorium intybus]
MAQDNSFTASFYDEFVVRLGNQKGPVPKVHFQDLSASPNGFLTTRVYCDIDKNHLFIQVLSQQRQLGPIPKGYGIRTLPHISEHPGLA